mgnify:CR=1 FL=1
MVQITKGKKFIWQFIWIYFFSSSSSLLLFVNENDIHCKWEPRKNDLTSVVKMCGSNFYAKQKQRDSSGVRLKIKKLFLPLFLCVCVVVLDNNNGVRSMDDEKKKKNWKSNQNSITGWISPTLHYNDDDDDDHVQINRPSSSSNKYMDS